MGKNIKFSILNNDIEDLDILKEKYTHINIINTATEIKFEFEDTIDNKVLISCLDSFLSNIMKKNIYKLANEYYFDEHNYLIKSPKKNYALTNKEALFLKTLILRNEIISYDEMFELLWQEKEYVSLNALRQFIKNLKRKLPRDILINYSHRGYKLISK